MQQDQPNKFSLHAADETSFRGGTLQTATAEQFPVLKGLSMQSLRLEPGAIREPHVHPNAAQMDYVVGGKGRVGIIGPGGATQVLEMGPGDVSFIPHGHAHWIENISDEPLHFILIVNHERPETIHVSDLLRGLPRDTVERAYGGVEGVSTLLSGS